MTAATSAEPTPPSASLVANRRSLESSVRETCFGVNAVLTSIVAVVTEATQGEGLADDPDRAFHAELSLLAAVLGAQDAGEDVYTRPLVDLLLLDAAW